MNNSKKIRVLIITPSLQCGGSEKMSSLICNHLDEEKFIICLLVVDNADPFYTISNPAVEIIDLQKKRVLFALGGIRRVVKQFGPDIIFTTANHINLYLAIFRNRFNRRIIFIAREASVVSINSRQAKMPALYSRLIRMFYKRFDHIICQSAYMQQDLVAHYQIDIEKTYVINNAVQAQELKYHKDQLPGRVYKFITVARLSAEKGIERLVHAAGLLSIPFTYHIVGDGPKRKELERLIADLHLQDKIFLHGKRKEPFAGMEDADLLLMGSYYEGFPNVLLEAGALGIPAIAFDVPGGIDEIIKPGVNGILVEDNDLIAFASAINRKQFEEFDRQAIIDNTNTRFELNAVITQYEELFLQLAGNK